MTKNQLFRPEALEKRKSKELGSILLTRPLVFTHYAVVAAVCGLALLMLALFGSYAMRSTGKGQLAPIDGLIRVMPTMAGVVQEKRIVEGQHVRQGQILFIVSGERQYAAGDPAQAAIAARIQHRQTSLQEDLEHTRAVQLTQSGTLRRQIDNLTATLGKLDDQIAAKRARVTIFDKTSKRYQALLEQNFVSPAQVQERQAMLLEEQAALQALEREQLLARRELADGRATLQTLPGQQAKELAAIGRNMDMAAQEFIENEGRRQQVVIAPVSGIVTVIAADVGQATEPSRPLLRIVPDNSQLEAQLHVGSKAVGMIRAGDEVILRYEAFPYQKFGHAKGKVVSVARAAVASGELGGTAGAASAEPLYAVRVRLASQDVLAYGKREPLVAGMLVEGDILQARRKLYEWITEPIYTITGRL
jgi:membrane fusion protein